MTKRKEKIHQENVWYEQRMTKMIKRKARVFIGRLSIETGVE